MSFTGSIAAGKAVGALATQNLKPSVLELGGSDPFIIFDDADLETAIKQGYSARFSNNGQTCISAKRFLIQKNRFDDAIERMINIAKDTLNFGDPLNPSTTIGPMARADLKDHLKDQLNRANVGSAIRFKYEPSKNQGYFTPPLVIDARSLDKSNPLFTEEIFGPIAVFDTFNTVEEAIEKANNTQFGLGASIWSNSSDIIHKCSDAIECGSIAINRNVHSAFGTPFWWLEIIGSWP